MVTIKVSGFEEKEEKLTLKEEKSGLLGVSDYLFNKVVDGERENLLMRLVGRFKSLRYEDLEEVYNDGCLVLWNKMMDKAWDRLKDVDRMILESYYVDGCRMEEIARRIGYRNGNSVKSRKNKVIRRMMEMMQEEVDFKDLPLAA